MEDKNQNLSNNNQTKKEQTSNIEQKKKSENQEVTKDTKKIEKTDKKEKVNNKKQIKEQKKAEKLALKQEKQRKKIEKRTQKNTRWFWFFILFLLAIILLFMWDNHRKTKLLKAQTSQIDTLNNKVHILQTKYQEKDSALNLLLANYNALLSQNIEDSRELNSRKQELLRLQKIVYLQDSVLREVKSAIDVALSGYTANQVAVEMKDGKLYITMRNKLLFPSGSANVQSSGMTALKTLSKVLKQNPNIDIVIEGHTDNVPINPKDKKFTDNWDLSTARAISVTRILTKKYNIAPERIIAAGRSMYYPVAPNTTVEGRAKNRRIEFILTPNLEDLYKLADAQIVTSR